VTVVRGLSRVDRRMLVEEARELRARLAQGRPSWFPVVEWAQDRAAARARLREIEEELAA